MDKLRSRNGFSRIEIICIIGIVLVVLFVVMKGVQWMRVSMAQTEDAMLVENAERIAETNIAGGGCPVNDCKGGETCEHRTKDGSYVAYFDHPNNRIVSEPVKGYNEYSTMTIGEQTYYGEPDTMVIQIVVKDGVITLSWVEGEP